MMVLDDQGNVIDGPEGVLDRPVLRNPPTPPRKLREPITYVVTVLLSSRTVNETRSTATMSWRGDCTEAEAFRSAIDHAFKTKPGFSVDDYIVAKIEAPKPDGNTHPPLPEGTSLFAVDPRKNKWHYVNHAGTWQGMPNPIYPEPVEPVTANDVIGIVKKWLEKEDPTHYGEFEKDLQALVAFHSTEPKE